MKKKPDPGTAEFLIAVRKALTYSPHTGVLKWKDTGDVAGVDKNGQPMMVAFQHRRHPPAVLAWLIQTGEFVREVGVRNGIESDLRWMNLFAFSRDSEVSITRSGDLFVLMNEQEQVLVSSDISEVVRVAQDILKFSCGVCVG